VNRTGKIRLKMNAMKKASVHCFTLQYAVGQYCNAMAERSKRSANCAYDTEIPMLDVV